MIANDCKFGICTNGEEVFLAVRKPESPQELFLSQRKNWSHSSTAKAIIGLTYAAIDEKRGNWTRYNPEARNRGRRNHGQGQNIDIISELIGHPR